jgi:GGDEF domain-containing protein
VRSEAAYHAAVVAEKIREALARPYQLKEHEHSSPPSIGICLFHGNDEPMDVLLKHADAAMYQSKGGGGNTVRFFDADLQREWDLGTMNGTWDISE